MIGAGFVVVAALISEKAKKNGFWVVVLQRWEWTREERAAVDGGHLVGAQSVRLPQFLGQSLQSSFFSFLNLSPFFFKKKYDFDSLTLGFALKILWDYMLAILRKICFLD